MSLSPTSGIQANNVTIQITGDATHFQLNTTTANFGSGITSGTVTVNGPTNASVNITISTSAAIGPRNITIATGSEVANGTFTVNAGTPAITSISPNNGQPSQTENVVISAVLTSFQSGVTTVDFGSDVTVNSLIVDDVMDLTANVSIASSAILGPRDVTVTTGSQVLTVPGGFNIQTCTNSTPMVVLSSPTYGETNVPINTLAHAQFSVPMDRTTFAASNFYLYDTLTAQTVTTATTIDATGRIATLTPSQSLAVNRTYDFYVDPDSTLKDQCGNIAQSQSFYFTTSFSDDTSGPILLSTSPENGDTAPPNAPVVLQFNEPIDPVSQVNGLGVSAFGMPVTGTSTFSSNNTLVTFQPTSQLTAGIVYTVSYTAQLTDVAGNPLVNPGSFSFTGGSGTDISGPSVVATVPVYGASGVGVNVAVRFVFSEQVDPITVNASDFVLYDNNAGQYLPATVTVAADRMSATLTPAAPLLPYNYYSVGLNGYTDIAGNAGSSASIYFYTGGSADTTGAQVAQISPPNGAIGVPRNAQVVVQMSDDLDGTTVTTSAIQVSPTGSTTPIAGTVTLASDLVTLTFVPTSPLAAGTTYNVFVGGFRDTEGNLLPVPSTPDASFTTGSLTLTSAPTVIASTPLNGASGVAVNTTIALTFSAAIDPLTVNSKTLRMIAQNSGGAQADVAAGYAVTAADVTVTPLTNLPGNSTIYVYLYGVADLAGNAACCYYAIQFTTANTADTTPLTATIAPADGTSNVGINAPVMVTFSKSINPGTLSGNAWVFNGDTPYCNSYSISQDNRTLIFNCAWPSASTMTVELTYGIQDLSGNALADTHSQFTTVAVAPNSQGSVVGQRPGNGATAAPDTTITLFTNVVLNTSTITGALHVAQDGVVVDGTLSYPGDGQTIVFTPSSNFSGGALVQVFLDSAAQDTYGNALNSYSGQFNIAPDLTVTAPQWTAMSPAYASSDNPQNAPIYVQFNEAMDPATVNATNLYLTDSSDNIVSLTSVGLIPSANNVAELLPAALLSNSGSYYYVHITSALHNTSGLGVSNAGNFYFYVGFGSDTTPPTVLGIAPPNGAGTAPAPGVGTNAVIRVTFSKPIDPLTVNSNTIQINGGAIPSSLTFNSNNTEVTLTPLAPLPVDATVTVAVTTAVQDVAGNSVTAVTSSFTTAAGPDSDQPYVVNSSVTYGAVNVPTNSVFTLVFSEPMDTSTITAYPTTPGGTVSLYDYSVGYLPITLSFSSDSRTVTVTPNAPLGVGDSLTLGWCGSLDLEGNSETCGNIVFTAGTDTDTMGPEVAWTTPSAGLTAPTNALIQIEFDESVRPDSLASVSLVCSAKQVAVTNSLTRGDTVVVLTPAAPLPSSSSCTLTIAGVLDTAGLAMTSHSPVTFNTAAGIDLTQPTLLSTSPAANSTVTTSPSQVSATFSKAMDTISFNPNSNFYLQCTDGSCTVGNISATLSFSGDRTMAILTPASTLAPGTYSFTIWYGLLDLAGNGISNYQTVSFTVQ